METEGVEKGFFVAFPFFLISGVFVFLFFSFYNGKEFSVCTVERAGREVSKRKISWWKKGRVPVSDDVIREDS